MEQPLLEVANLIEGKIVKRPSIHIKTPYVADVNAFGSNLDTVLAHTASLGCCGLADAGASVLMSPISNNTSKDADGKLKCEYRVYLSIFRERGNEIFIGIHPKLAEDLVESALKSNKLTKLLNVQKYKRETVIKFEDKVDSRFDFSGIDENGIPFIMEVKNVPLADYEDIGSKEREKKKKKNPGCYDSYCVNSKIAYFPDGYRKKALDTISPRALKHIKELGYIKSVSKTRCIMCYVIQRPDVKCFQPSKIDPEYCAAFVEAISKGVEVITMVVSWNLNGTASFVTDCLPLS